VASISANMKTCLHEGQYLLLVTFSSVKGRTVLTTFGLVNSDKIKGSSSDKMSASMLACVPLRNLTSIIGSWHFLFSTYTKLYTCTSFLSGQLTNVYYQLAYSLTSQLCCSISRQVLCLSSIGSVVSHQLYPDFDSISAGLNSTTAVYRRHVSHTTL